MRIETRQFSGERPKVSGRLLGENEASIALDCELVSGELRPIRSNRIVRASKVSGARTLFILDGEYFTWAGDVDVQETPVDAAVRRLFVTGDGAPKQIDVATGERYLMGIPKPLSAPVINSVSNPGGLTGEEQDELNAGLPIDSLYRFSYLNRWGEEGDLSDPSEIFTYRSGQTIVVANVGEQDSANLADYGIVGYRLYRLAEGESKFVGEFSLSQIVVRDKLKESELGEVAVSEDYYLPPPNLEGIHVMANGVALGFVGQKVHVSEPNNLNVWPYNFDVSSDVVGVSSFDNNATILTTGFPVIATIFDPRNISTSVLNEREPCVAKRGIAQGLGGVLYPAPSGLFFIGSGGGQMLTNEHYDEADWRALRPGTFTAAFRDGEYIAFHGNEGDGRGWVFDTREPNAVVRQLSQWASAVYVREGTDDLHMVRDTLIELYQGGEDRVDYLWQSKLFGDGSPFALTTRRLLSPGFAANPTELEAAAAEASLQAVLDYNASVVAAAATRSPQQGIGGALGQAIFGATSLGGDFTHRLPRSPFSSGATMNVYGEKTLIHSELITDDEVDRIEYADRQRYWHYSLRGSADITQITLAGSATELHTGS